jgi:xanthine/uracil permease
MAQHPHDPHHPASPVHPVDEKPAAGRLVPAALQHIAAMYAGVVTPPLIIGQAVGLATLLGPVFGGFPTSAFAQNVGVVSLTRVRSRYVVALAGATLLVLGASPVLGAVVSLVPMPVLGGAGIVLFGSIAVSGIRTLSEAGLDDSSHIILVAVSLGAGIIPLAAPTFYADFPAWAQTVLGSGISAGALTAVGLNLFFHHLGTRSSPRAAVLSAASSGSGTQIP